MPVKNQRAPEKRSLGGSTGTVCGVSTGGGVMVGSDDMIRLSCLSRVATPLVGVPFSCSIIDGTPTRGVATGLRAGYLEGSPHGLRITGHDALQGGDGAFDHAIIRLAGG